MIDERSAIDAVSLGELTSEYFACDGVRRLGLRCRRRSRALCLCGFWCLRFLLYGPWLACRFGRSLKFLDRCFERANALCHICKLLLYRVYDAFQGHESLNCGGLFAAG